MNCFQNVKYGVSCREAVERYGVEVNHYDALFALGIKEW